MVVLPSALVITTANDLPGFDEQNRYSTAVAEALLWGADRGDRFQSLPRWRGESSRGAAQRASVGEFVSVFTWCDKSDGDDIICGHWVGRTEEDRIPVSYPTIWSAVPLSLERLRRAAQRVRVHILLNADNGFKIDAQPRVRTLRASRKR